MNPRNAYAWTEQAGQGMTAWALVVCVSVAAGVSSLLDFGDTGGATQIVLIILGVSLAGGLLLGRIRCEVSVSDGLLLFRSRPVFGTVLNWPWTEHRFARRSIGASRLDRSPWTLPKLTIWLDDGSSLAILGPRASAGSDAFESFVAAFRAFAGADPGRRVQDASSIWRFPVYRALIAGVVVACGAFAILAVEGMMDQKSTMIVVITALMLVLAGARFLLKSE